MTTEIASCGIGTLPGNVWRPGDPAKHLGPPETLGIGYSSRLFQTRCGLSAADGPWAEVGVGENDDVWCPGCLEQAGIPATRESLGA